MRRSLIFCSLLLVSAAARADYEVTHNFESRASAAGVKRVIIDIPAGEIKVRNGAGNAISLTGNVRRDYDGFSRREKNQRIVDDISVEIYLNRDEAVIRRHFGPNAQGWRAENFSEIEVTIEVPEWMSLEFEMNFGEVKLDGTFGDVDLDLRAGEITMRTPRSSVRQLNASCRVGEVNTDLGDEIIEREGVFPGRTHFSNPTGGRSHVNLHVTAGEVNVQLTR